MPQRRQVRDILAREMVEPLSPMSSQFGDKMSPTHRAAEAVRRTATRLGFRDGPRASARPPLGCGAT